MNHLKLNNLLNRKKEEKLFIDTLNNFELNKNNLTIKKGIYVYGSSGIGKTYFVKQLLKKMNYDIIYYDAGDVRNRTIIEKITKDNMANTNVLSLFKKKRQKLIILMDEIDGMNSGDKGGINTLIKLIRPKKTNKQKKENRTNIPVICIGNYHIDKKIKEIMKTCVLIELKTPDTNQIKLLSKLLLPKIKNDIIKDIVHYINGDLRKLDMLCNIYNKNPTILNKNTIQNVFFKKYYNTDTKNTTKLLLNNQYNLTEHFNVINDTDRTSVSLLFHENIIDVLESKNKTISIPFYHKILNNICFGDYIDRITFQKQIWIFNEMSSLIKTLYNNYLYHTSFVEKEKFNPQEVRFTKVLTKYSTEYNNSVFLQQLCYKLQLNKSELMNYFSHLRKENTIENICLLFEKNNCQITKLDIERLFRYIDKFYVEEYYNYKTIMNCDSE